MNKVGTVLAAVLFAAATSTAVLVQAGGGAGAGGAAVLPEVLALAARGTKGKSHAMWDNGQPEQRHQQWHEHLAEFDGSESAAGSKEWRSP